MERFKSRLGWALAGALGIVLVLALARATVAGPLDPPGPVASTMRTIDELLPSWGKTLTSSGGCTSQRFTCVMSNAAVLDHETGLVWERTPYQGANALTWYDARGTCAGLSTGDRLGWRMPTQGEIESLMTAQFILPAGHPFTGISNTLAYWTSSAGLLDPEKAIGVAVNGLVFPDSYDKWNIQVASSWCVRGQQGLDEPLASDASAWSRTLAANTGPDACNSPRFKCVMSNQAVLDHETGLVWQRTAASASNTSWTGANFSCLFALTGARRGWRSPTIAEALSLFEATGHLPTGHPFLNVIAGAAYATSTSSDTGLNGLYFSDNASIGTLVKVNFLPLASWCVRGAGGGDSL